MDGAVVTRRAELARLAAATRAALGSFGIERARLRTLRHEHNTTFRVDAGHGDRYVLRISRAGVHDARTVAAELAWLDALHHDTDLGVPVPVAALDGSPVVTIDDRPAVLLRWQDGRIVQSRLTPRHLRACGDLIARLQDHAASWRPEPTFVRPRVDTVTTAAKASSIAAAPRPGPVPSDDDVTAIGELGADLLSADAAAVVGVALDVARATTSTLAGIDGSSGLIHGDLHAENTLFHDGVARAIDFDDCGWGFHLYDLAVALWELEARPDYPALRASLLEGFSARRPLPPDHDRHLAALFVLRRVQILAWILESRDHVAFRDDWHEWATDEVTEIEAAVARSS